MGNNSDTILLDDFDSDGVSDNYDLYPLDFNRSKNNKNPRLVIFSLVIESFLGYLLLRV